MRQEKALADRVVEARLAACVLAAESVRAGRTLHESARRRVRLEPELNQIDAYRLRSAIAPQVPPRNSVRICHQRAMQRPTYGPSRKKRPPLTVKFADVITSITSSSSRSERPIKIMAMMEHLIMLRRTCGMARTDARRVSSRIMAHGRASSWRVSYSSTLSACELLWCFKNFTPKPISVASRVPSSGCSQVVTPETLYSPSASPTPSKRSAAVVDSRLRSGRWRADGIWSAIF